MSEIPAETPHGVPEDYMSDGPWQVAVPHPVLDDLDALSESIYGPADQIDTQGLLKAAREADVPTDLREDYAALLETVLDKPGGPKPYDVKVWCDTGRYFDREGRPINMILWSLLYEIFDYKIVQRTHIGPARVSTAWLGMDHGWLEDGEPLIFETMIFPRRRRDKHAPWADWQARWSTEKEARQAHETIVNLIRARGVNAIRTRKQEAEFWRDWRRTYA